MSSDEYRRKARDIFAVAQLVTSPEDRTEMLTIAASWLERAEAAEQRERLQQQQQEGPEKGSASGN
jgi:DNA invertase Pin-like site-specific DNA recombinase